MYDFQVRKILYWLRRCSIRHLYALKEVPQTEKDALIATARNMERRRCNHHTLEEPLSTLDCFQTVIDPKKSFTNKNRYIVASQDEAVRRFCRGVKGVPLVFVKRSVMVMEPMAESTVGAREGLERSKFRSGLRGRGAVLLGKRKRETEDIDSHVDLAKESVSAEEITGLTPKKKRTRGPKGPNPLAVKKSKKVVQNRDVDGEDFQDVTNTNEETIIGTSTMAANMVIETLDNGQDVQLRRTRKRKRKPTIKQAENHTFANAIDGNKEAVEGNVGD